jgi:nicotinamide mononucleotide (NMN) deamidase PncC
VHIRVLDESGETGVLIEQPGSRRQIRERAAHTALNQLRLRLLDT